MRASRTCADPSIMAATPSVLSSLPVSTTPSYPRACSAWTAIASRPCPPHSSCCPRPPLLLLLLLPSVDTARVLHSCGRVQMRRSVCVCVCVRVCVRVCVCKGVSFAQKKKHSHNTFPFLLSFTTKRKPRCHLCIPLLAFLCDRPPPPTSPHTHTRAHNASNTQPLGQMHTTWMSVDKMHNAILNEHGGESCVLVVRNRNVPGAVTATHIVAQNLVSNDA